MSVEKVTIGNAELYCGDSQEIVSDLEVDRIVTDPVWPNCPDGLLCGADSTQGVLCRNVLKQINAATVVVVLGFDSDPRWLAQAVPDRKKWQFVRTQTMPYAVPAYRGRLLGGDEVAYVFGAIPKRKGVIPGRLPVETTHKRLRVTGHPCPRSDTHMRALVGHWSLEGEMICDPFMGTGSIGVVSVSQGRKFIGIEIERKYFDIACERIEAAQAQGRLAL